MTKTIKLNRTQKAWTAVQHKALVANALTDADHKPVVKYFCPWGAATWLITEITEITEDGDILMFGLCDLGLGFPELGYVNLRELIGLRGPFGLRIERDLHFTATKTIGEYADEARENGRIAA